MTAGPGARGGRGQQSRCQQAGPGNLAEDNGLSLDIAVVLVLAQHHELPPPGGHVLNGQPVHRGDDAARHPADAHHAHAELSLHPGQRLRRRAPSPEVHERILRQPHQATRRAGPKPVPPAFLAGRHLVICAQASVDEAGGAADVGGYQFVKAVRRGGAV